MGLLSGIIECVTALAAGFFGHVAAHDFCEATPMISRKIIQLAVSCLPKGIRDRYAAEWAADLYDQPGAIPKLFWAARCLWSVHRLRREERAQQIRQTAVEFVLANGELVICDLATWYLLKSIVAVSTSKIGRWLIRLPRPLDDVPIARVLVPALVRQRRFGTPDKDKALRLAMSLLRRNQRPRSIVVTYNGVKQHEPLNVPEFAERFDIDSST